MLTRMRAGVVGPLLLALFPFGARADPIDLTGVLRSAIAVTTVRDASGAETQQSMGQDTGEAPTATALSLAGLSSASANAGLFANVSDPHHIWGSGAAGASVETTASGFAMGVAQFSVGLRVYTEHAFTFVGTFATSGVDGRPASVSGGVWQAVLSGPGGDTTFFNRGFDSAVVTESGVIPSGEYRLLVTSQGHATVHQPGLTTGTATYAFTFDLADTSAPVPEPASMFLVGSGILGLARLRRRRNAWRNANAGRCSPLDA